MGLNDSTRGIYYLCTFQFSKTYYNGVLLFLLLYCRLVTQLDAKDRERKDRLIAEWGETMFLALISHPSNSNVFSEVPPCPLVLGSSSNLLVSFNLL